MTSKKIFPHPGRLDRKRADRTADRQKDGSTTRRCENQVIRAALRRLANALRDGGSIDMSECYIDATFASAKGGGRLLVRWEYQPTNFLGLAQLAARCILLKQF
jgi:hypothetical protein